MAIKPKKIANAKNGIFSNMTLRSNNFRCFKKSIKIIVTAKDTACPFENKDKETGITIHWVNDKYDEGQIIFQEEMKVAPGDTAEAIAQKVHTLEYKNYPAVIEKVLNKI